MKMIIEGTPISQIRMKFSGRNGVGRVYDPREKQKKALKKIIAEKFGDHEKFLHPQISFAFFMPIPKSLPKKVLKCFESGLLKYEKKPDVDNLLKLYLDCLDNICFDGDQKVSLGHSIKLYDPNPRTIIFINETAPIITNFELEQDPVMWNEIFSSKSYTQSFSEMVYSPDSKNLFVSKS